MRVRTKLALLLLHWAMRLDLPAVVDTTSDARIAADIRKVLG